MKRYNVSEKLNKIKMNKAFILLAVVFFTGVKLIFANTVNPPINQDWEEKATATFGLEENKGQVTGEDAHKVKYFHNSGGVSVFLLNDGLAYQFTKIHYPEGYKPTGKGSSSEEMEQMDKLSEQIRTETYRMDVRLVGANPNPKISAEGKSKDYIQYYNHNVLGVHGYQKVTYHNVYPNIDWVVYKDGENLKYDFVVHPGGNPALIKLQTKWVENTTLNKDGSLTLSNRMGEITEKAPVSFQGEREIKTAFVLSNDIISFQLENYDKAKTLVIDPTLIWGTYYGSGTWGYSCTTDGVGNVYLAGIVGNSYSDIAIGGHQNTHPGTGNIEAFLVKFNSSGVRQWGTYYGGNGSDFGYECTTDNFGNVYLCGKTNSTNNIAYNGHLNTVSPGLREFAFLVKFDSNGVRQWGTYYGQNTAYKNTIGYGCATDGSNNVYLVGKTNSESDIAFNGHQNTHSGSYTSSPGDEAFLVKFDENGVRLWGTYYGGYHYDDGGHSCATDASGNVYMSGLTRSFDGIAFNGHQNSYAGEEDAFLVKFDANGVRQWGTYYGGGGSEYGNSMCAADNSGNVYLAISTKSTTNIASGGHQNSLSSTSYSDAALIKFDANGVRLWGTYYGGAKTDLGRSCVVDGNGDVILSGITSSLSSLDDISTTGTYTPPYGNSTFLVKFDANGVRKWGTYYGLEESGSSIYHQTEFGGAGLGESCTVDNNGNVYVCGSGKFYHGSSNGHQYLSQGSHSAYLGKFYGTPCLTLEQPDTISGAINVCEGAVETYSVPNDTNATSYTWTLPNGWSGTSTTNSITVTAGASGGTIAVVAQNNCGASPGENITVSVTNSATSTINHTACGSYTWTNGNGQTYTSSTTAAHTIPNGAMNGCDSTITLHLTINQPTTSTLNVTNCGAYTLNGQTYASSGTYTQILQNANNCDSTITLNLTVNQPTTSTLNVTNCGAYTLNSQTYTSSGTYTQMLTNANNCDSTITLNLTINQPTASILNVTNCGAYTLNSQTYTSSGTYTQIVQNANNCDSTITLNLTINQPTTHTITETACVSYTLNSQTYTSSGTYTQTLTNANNCDSTITLHLTITNVDNTVSQNGATLTANQSGAAYQWIDCSTNNPIAGATNQTFVATVNGNYAVVIAWNSCTDTSSCIAVQGIGVNENEPVEVNVFPNPSDGVFTITSELLENATIEIFTSSGKLLAQYKSVYGETFNIELSDTPSGVYLLKLTNRESSIIQKLIKK